MLKKLPKTSSQIGGARAMEPEKPPSEEQNDPSEEVAELPKFEPKSINRDSLYVTFSGIIEFAELTDDEQLSVLFTIWAGEDWKLVNGQKSGLSQVASCYASTNKKLSWNMPFEVTYETTVPSGWPQLVLELHGRDFFGRNVVRGYGCVHLPSAEGKYITYSFRHERTVHLFQPKPISVITGLLGYLNGCTAEYKEAEKVLATGEGREVTRVKTTGQAHVKVETVKYNFNLYGYS